MHNHQMMVMERHPFSVKQEITHAKRRAWVNDYRQLIECRVIPPPIGPTISVTTTSRAVWEFKLDSTAQ